MIPPPHAVPEEPPKETWPPEELVEQATKAAHDTFKTEPVLVKPGHNPWSAVARAALSCPAVTEYVEGLRQERDEQWALREQLQDELAKLRRTLANAEQRTGRWFRALNEIRALCDDAQRVAPAGQQIGRLLDETGSEVDCG